MEGLIEGRNIHYVAYNGRHLAAIIIGVNDEASGDVDIALFTNLNNVNGDKNFGLQFHQNVKPASDTIDQPGTWHFIERK